MEAIGHAIHEARSAFTQQKSCVFGANLCLSILLLVECSSCTGYAECLEMEDLGAMLSLTA